MNAVKASWVGQTFALAKCSDSGGKKSRIRRSKEERKAMVESFIKKYQNSNNGNFPSLNLTHKEVGGSFYTVREIVREIIQENRVLGPAKLTPEEHNTDPLLEHYPLGSISTEPQSHLSFSSNEVHFIANDHQSSMDSTSSGQSNGRQIFDNGRYINGDWVEEEYKESDARKFSEPGRISIQEDDEPIYTEVQVSEKIGVKNVIEASATKVTPIAAEVIVETFPLRSAAKPTHSTIGRSDEARELTGTLEEKETEKVEVAPSSNGPVLSRMDFLEKNSSSLLKEMVVANLADPLLENSSGSTTILSTTSSILEGTEFQVDVSHNEVLTLQSSDQNQVIAGTEPKIAPNDIHTKNGNVTDTSSSRGESISKEVVGIENEADIPHSGSIKEGSKSTLNRLNLESWEGASKKSPESETNPVWAVFKAFVTAFMKFWPE